MPACACWMFHKPCIKTQPGTSEKGFSFCGFSSRFENEIQSETERGMTTEGNDGDNDKVDDDHDGGGVVGAKGDVVVNIRRFLHDDGPSVAKIWNDGLRQTIEESYWPLSAFFAKLFEKEVVSVLGPNGDIGPNGSNIYNFWIGRDDNTNNPTSEFFVATINNKVVGCVGVKVGQTSLKEHCSSDNSNVGVKEEEEEEEEGKDDVTMNIDRTFVSVWRLSVDETYRRSGVATKLMDACHTWAKEKAGVKNMKLMTGNPVAAKFYLKLGYHYEHWYSFGSLIKPL